MQRGIELTTDPDLECAKRNPISLMCKASATKVRASHGNTYLIKVERSGPLVLGERGQVEGRKEGDG